jgi:NAD-dependent dihydropyrimidine dehydrogenase PreA subunit
MAEPCAPEAGRVEPIVDRARCEAKEDCVRVCPYHVFEVRRLSDGDAGASAGWRAPSSSSTAGARRSPSAPPTATRAGCA